MSNATLANLVAQMNQDQEVLQGWDAVLNLLESSVNDFFLLQWNGQTNNSNQMSIAVIGCNDLFQFQGAWITNVSQFECVLGPPLFQFLSGQSQVTVTQDILSGSTRTGTMTVPSTFDPSTCVLSLNDTSVSWNGPPQPVDTSTNPTMTGTVALSNVRGLNAHGLNDPNAESLVLDFSKGAFTLDQTVVSDPTIGAQIQDWFNANEVKYIIASVSLQNLSGQSSLTPTCFQFNIATTDSGNTIVQILITTDGSTPSNASINVDEPVPTDDDLTCSLMLSSRIAFQTVLAGGFNQGSSQYQLVAAPPQSAAGAWSAYLTPQIEFSGSFSFGSCCDKTTNTYHIYLGGTYTGSTSSGYVLSQQITTQGNVTVNISVSASNPISLSGSGSSQVMTVVPGTPSVTVTGSVESEITSQLQSILTSDFQGAMAGLSFSSVTVFALMSLLFPGNLISMSQVQVPADLLIVGTFSPQGG